jgi:Fumarylacetoacetate (FAA) hydrolase family
MSGTVTFVVPPVEVTMLPVIGGGLFPVRRVYCVGRNYVSHIREMKEADERDPPFFFQKPRDSIVCDGDLVPTRRRRTTSNMRSSWCWRSARMGATSPLPMRRSTSGATPSAST